MSTYIIGDVQGCWQSLQKLLDAVDYDPTRDQLGFVGDLINRGPESLQVLRFVKDLKDPLLVLGNHEIYAIIIGRGHIPRDRYENTLDALLDAPDNQELTDWLMTLPLVLPLANDAGVMVHAGIPPQWSTKEAVLYSEEFQAQMQDPHVDAFLKICFGDEPAHWDNSLTGHDRIRYIVNAFTRMRFCSQSGELELTEKGNNHSGPERFKPWFEWRQPDPVPLFFGHWAKLNGQCSRPSTFALDTGCVHGGKLTALRLEDQRLFSV